MGIVAPDINALHPAAHGQVKAGAQYGGQFFLTHAGDRVCVGPHCQKRREVGPDAAHIRARAHAQTGRGDHHIGRFLNKRIVVSVAGAHLKISSLAHQVVDAHESIGPAFISVVGQVLVKGLGRCASFGLRGTNSTE